MNETPKHDGGIDHERRSFLLAGAGACAAVAVAYRLAGPPPQTNNAFAPKQPLKSGYHESDHIKRYYASMRY